MLVVFDEENGLHFDADDNPWTKFKESPFNLVSFRSELQQSMVSHPG